MTLIKRIPKGDPLTFQEMDGNWDDLSARLTSLQSLIDLLDGRVTTLTGLSSTVSTHTSDIASLVSTDSSHNSRLSALESQLTSLTTRVTALETAQTGNTVVNYDGTANNYTTVSLNASFVSFIKLTLSGQCRVRGYTSAIARDTDASRTLGVYPTPGTGVVFEVSNIVNNYTYWFSPVPAGYFSDKTLYLNITNAASNITYSFQAVRELS